jgi:hypothetical protein
VKPWIYFETLARRHNTPVITYWIGRSPTVWICEAQAASEILDKRASIYSSRPRMVVFGELSMGQSNIVSMFYGDRWRLHRKLTHMGVGLQHVRSYSGFQNNESRVVALDLVRDPSEYVMHFERYATSVVSIIGFNRRVKDKNDPIITDVIAIMQRAAELNVPGKKFPMLMETFPCKLTPTRGRRFLSDKQRFPISPTGWPLGNMAWAKAAAAERTSTTLSPRKPHRKRTMATAMRKKSWMRRPSTDSQTWRSPL